jgi:hypothetical protein
MYWQANGTWAKEAEQARQFQSTTDAVNACLDARCDSYEIVMRHPNDSKYDLVILERRPKPSKTP